MGALVNDQVRWALCGREQELIIKSSLGAGKLKLSESKQTGIVQAFSFLHVSLEDLEMSASCSRIYLYEPSNLVAFFAELASHWKGWEGAKEWNSVEGDLGLLCTSDSLGHVAMQVKLKSGLDEDNWSVQTVIRIDAGQLEELAIRLKEFFLPNAPVNQRLPER